MKDELIEIKLFQKSTKIGEILRLMNKAIESKNYWLTKDYKRAIFLSCLCMDLPFLILYKSNVDTKLDVAAFEKTELAKSYGSLVKVIYTPNLKIDETILNKYKTEVEIIYK
ncbi:hypothetical protein A3C57_00745 [Candidatus Nomurabacteria bacterium RIFCSPHIGHO2_02_FULL_33_12]|uniref:Uncharacterized protein n=1 Tax=Candidatus Nomurabacteria bacterium RIFCSPLOWO2_01_FULL_33_17 TaxID=1801764 RepID=A0A1F6WQV9_9BACT|nr:MAG: hypothetical protein A3C57_00745 [Candidatus Nomurabacteria bacterium RIFCSPHIGHO2_02_FULL_33_12]OGI84261.1 MAG: hypothetical protein A2903_00085 [Candidatus Nomurabacteria bacterium RIFCSPLOWO2_01_FULL_33_17]